MPRFSLRELLMLMTICAILMPYLYSRAFTTPRIGLSWEAVRGMVTKVEPAATIQSGSGGTDHVELTCLIPAANSDAFFPKLHTAIKEHIDDSGWSNQGSRSSTSNGLLTGFSYDMLNGSSRCSVVAILLDKKKGKDWVHDKDVDEVSFIILSPQSR